VSSGNGGRTTLSNVYIRVVSCAGLTQCSQQWELMKLLERELSFAMLMWMPWGGGSLPDFCIQHRTRVDTIRQQ